MNTVKEKYKILNTKYLKEYLYFSTKSSAINPNI